MTQYKVIDTHIHLYEAAGLSTLRWMTDDSPIAYDHGFEQYVKECKGDSTFSLAGAIFIEADVKTDLGSPPESLAAGLDEYRMVLRQAAKSQGRLVAAIPWIPLPLGREKVQEYHDKILALGDPHLLKGYRFLLQDKPDGVMLQPDFVDALNWLGEQGLVFDLGIDFHRRGVTQFGEFKSLLGKCHNIRLLVNHFGKPDVGNESSFEEWKAQMSQILDAEAKSSNELYFKLSGIFEEFDGGVEDLEDSVIIDKSLPYLKFLFESVPTARLMWASDWPVCKLPAGKNGFSRWLSVTEKLFDRLEVSESVRKQIYYDNAVKAYNLDE